MSVFRFSIVWQGGRGQVEINTFDAYFKANFNPVIKLYNLSLEIIQLNPLAALL